MKYTLTSVLAGLFVAGQVWAVPVLQIGAPGGAGEGAYADYQTPLTNPVEENTAVTSGSTLLVGGIFRNKVLSLGGKGPSGADWSSAGKNPNSSLSVFDGHGAVLVASVAEGTLAAALASLTVNGSLAFASNATMSFFPNNHDPLKGGTSDFLFFDVGDFTKNIADGVDNNGFGVPDFDPETGDFDGEIKTLTIGGTAGLSWVHFDIMALETGIQGQTTIVTTIENNPGSHDVTWKPGDGGGGGTGTAIPEPATLALLGLGLLGISVVRRRS